MGQQTLHTPYHCPCGLGSVILTTTAFGAGARKLHTAQVKCAVCKGHYRFALTPQPLAEHVTTGQKHPLVELSAA